MIILFQTSLMYTNIHSIDDLIKKVDFKLFRSQNVSASRGENDRAGGAKNEKSISEAACLLDRLE